MKLFSGKIYVIFSTILVKCLTTVVAYEPTAVINTTSGPIRGEILETLNSIKYAAFKGVRYAKAPIGYLRFKPPVPVDEWTEIFNATQDGDDCAQWNSATNDLKGSEDCLFINVFTPVVDLESTPKNLKSVMVWIYGGAFLTGTSSSSTYNPDYILEKDIVYVSMNYRLGAFGFLNLNHPNATGNAGLKDQVLALKWVQANIEKFGGNAKNVTIFGQSAGSASVGYQLLSDASKDLFQAAILMSGVPLNPWAFQTHEKALLLALKVGAILGTVTIDKDVLLETMYRVTARQIVEATARISTVIPTFSPTLENEGITTDVFLSTCSVDKYVTGNYNRVPVMLGFMDQETLSFYGSIKPFVEVITFAIATAQEIGWILPPGLRTVKILMDMGIDALEVITVATLNTVIAETTDLLFTAQIDQTQRFLVDNVKPVYYYHVSFHSNSSVHAALWNNTLKGAGHGDDVAYIFNILKINPDNDSTDLLARMIYRYSTMWTNFAKYGNPTPNWINDSGVNMTWPDSGLSGTCLEIGNELTVGPRPISAEALIIQTLSRPILGLINGCSIVL